MNKILIILCFLIVLFILGAHSHSQKMNDSTKVRKSQIVTSIDSIDFKVKAIQHKLDSLKKK